MVIPKKRTSAQRARLIGATPSRYKENVAGIKKQLRRTDLSPAQRDALTRQLKSLQAYL